MTILFSHLVFFKYGNIYQNLKLSKLYMLIIEYIVTHPKIRFTLIRSSTRYITTRQLVSFLTFQLVGLLARYLSTTARHFVVLFPHREISARIFLKIHIKPKRITCYHACHLITPKTLHQRLYIINIINMKNDLHERRREKDEPSTMLIITWLKKTQ